MLDWINPVLQDFVGVTIVRKVGAVPFDPYDGTLVYDGTGRDVLGHRPNPRSALLLRSIRL